MTCATVVKQSLLEKVKHNFFRNYRFFPILKVQKIQKIQKKLKTLKALRGNNKPQRMGKKPKS